jgi:hypothetical protein
MNKKEIAGTILILAAIVVGGAIIVPIAWESQANRFYETSYQIEFSSPNLEGLTIYMCKDNTNSWNSKVEQTRINYIQVDLYDSEYDYFETLAKDGVSYLYVKEQVNEDGFMTTEESPEFRFTYQSLLDNGGYANITLIDTYLLIEIVPWD